MKQYTWDELPADRPEPEPAERPGWWAHTFGAEWDKPYRKTNAGRRYLKSWRKKRRANDLKKHHVKVQRAIKKAKAAGRPLPTPPKLPPKRRSR